MSRIIQSTDKPILLQNQNYLDNKVTRLNNEICLLRGLIVDNGNGNGNGGGEIGEEIDPVFLASPAYGITSPSISNWNTAFGWGNHASAGYLTNSASATLTNKTLSGANNTFTAIPQSAITNLTTDLSGKANNVLTGYVSTTGTVAATDTVLQAIGKLNGNISAISTGLSGYVDTTTNQTAIAGNKTWTGVTTFSNNVNITGSFTPTTGSTYDLGTSSNKFATVYSNRLSANGTLTLISSTGSSILFSQTSPTSNVVGGFAATSGDFIVQAPGAALTASTGEKFQVYGTGKITGATNIGGNLTLTSIPALATTTTSFLVNDSGVVSSRTLAQIKTDLAVPDNTSYVDLTTNQATIAGNKGFTGTTSMVDLTVSGTINPNANNTLNLGSAGTRFAAMYSTAFYNTSGVTFGTTSASSGIFFRQGSTGTYTGGVFATTGNWWLQAQGSAPTDDTLNRLQVIGSVKSTQYRLSALNTAPSSATDTGILGEIRVTATFIYVCTATNTWVRAALATW